MGVEVAGEWEVLDRLPHQSSSNNEEEITESGLMLRETVTVRCNLFVMSYVRATLGKSHKEMHERFVARLLDGEEGHGEGG